MFGYTAAEAIGRSIRMLIPEELQDEEDVVLAKIRAGEKIDHYETIRQRKDGTRLSISLTVSPIRNEKGEIVGASKIARDITERSRLLAAAREHAANTEKLGEVGAVVASTLDRETIVQKVTDIATELTHAEFGAFFYNVTDPESGDAYMLYTLSGAPREAFAKFPAASRDGGVRADISRRRTGAARRRDRGSALRKERAVFRDAARPPARPQLPGGAGEGRLGRRPGRVVLRPLPGRRVHRTARAARARRGGVGLGGAGERPAVRGGAGREPDEGRVSRRPLTRAAHAAERDRRLLATAARRHPVGRQGGPRPRDARTERHVADADRGGRARRLAHRVGQDSAGRAAGGAPAHRRQRGGDDSARRRRQGRTASDDGRSARGTRVRRSGPSAAGRLESGVQRGEVHAEEGARTGAPRTRELARRDRRERHRDRHPAGFPPVCLRALSSGRRGHDAKDRRPGAGPRHRSPHRRNAWRHGRRLQRRRRTRARRSACGCR